MLRQYAVIQILIAILSFWATSATPSLACLISTVKLLRQLVLSVSHQLVLFQVLQFGISGFNDIPKGSRKCQIAQLFISISNCTYQVKLSECIGKKYSISSFYPLDFPFVCPTGLLQTKQLEKKTQTLADFGLALYLILLL